MNPSVRWQLKFGEHVIANIENAHASDWPWTYGTLVDSPQFETFRKYFTDWDLNDDDDPEIDGGLIGDTHHFCIPRCGATGILYTQG